MKTAIVYASKSGFTEKYALWLSASLSADLAELKTIKSGQLSGYDLIIYGGGLYAGGINGLKKFKSLSAEIEPSRIIYFATGATPPREDVVPELLGVNFKDLGKSPVTLFYLRGGFNYEKLNIVDKLLMSMMKAMIKSKKAENRTPDERGMLATYERPADFTQLKYIDPILEFVKKMEA